MGRSEHGEQLTVAATCSQRFRETLLWLADNNSIYPTEHIRFEVVRALDITLEELEAILLEGDK